MSVTSSGRSSIRRTIIYTSGWLCAMALAMSLSNIVLPVFGWATISPRCPFPMGEKRSITRTASGSNTLGERRAVSMNFSFGKSGVRWSKGTRSRTSSGVRPLILSTFTSGKYFSPSFGGRMGPSTRSPVRKPHSFTCDWDT
ncbi:hypothetical protein Barb4_04749 [Bacteroidales bacterium Barb4]|nr:hypothetical protein Barb4_04749 [Bacteroidales bacterium Barb4]